MLWPSTVVQLECSLTLSFLFHSEKVNNTRCKVKCNLGCVVTSINQVCVLNETNTVPITIAGTRHATTEEHWWTTPFNFCDCFAGERPQRSDGFRYFRSSFKTPFGEAAIAMSTDKLCSIRMPAYTFYFLRLFRWLDAECGLNTTFSMVPQNNQAFLVANENLFNNITSYLHQQCCSFCFWLGCGLVGLWVFFRLGVYCGCSPLAHGHPTSTCDAGVNVEIPHLCNFCAIV